MRMLICSTLLLVNLALPRPAGAAEEASRPWAIDVTFGTAVPVLFGPGATVELPYRILLDVEGGWLPGAYVDIINGIGSQFEGYDEVTELLVSAAADDSFILRLSAGWRPFPRLGLEVLVGYTIAAFGGDVASADIVQAATGREPPRTSVDVPLSAVMHGFHVAVGYRWVLWRHFVLRASLGYLQIVSSTTQTDLEGRTPAQRAAVETLNRELDRYMDDILTTYVKVPVISISGGYRF